MDVTLISVGRGGQFLKTGKNEPRRGECSAKRLGSEKGSEIKEEGEKGAGQGRGRKASKRQLRDDDDQQAPGDG